MVTGSVRVNEPEPYNFTQWLLTFFQSTKSVNAAPLYLHFLFFYIYRM